LGAEVAGDETVGALVGAAAAPVEDAVAPVDGAAEPEHALATSISVSATPVTSRKDRSWRTILPGLLREMLRAHGPCHKCSPGGELVSRPKTLLVASAMH
jgi:hypothetical protein